MLIRLRRIQRIGSETLYPNHLAPYNEHPEITGKLRACQKTFFDRNTMGLFYAFCIFVQSEGIGFVVYFSISAFMDNFTIYFANSDTYCQYIMQVALYTMALVTFLPNCIAAYIFQGRWYDQGTWSGVPGKTIFIVMMICVTITSFILRLFLVYKWGWAQFVHEQLADKDYKVMVAVVVPPLVDGVQTMLLVLSAFFSTALVNQAEYMKASTEPPQDTQPPQE